MRRVIGWGLVLAGCDPAVATIGEAPRACDDTFEAAAAWSVPTDDAGMYRQNPSFSADGAAFTQAAGYWFPTTRTWDPRAGAVLAEAQSDAVWVASRLDDATHGVDVLMRDASEDPSGGVLDVIDRADGRVRATIPGAGARWLGPAVALDGDTVALATCTDTDVLEVRTWSLSGAARDAWTVTAPCRVFASRTIAVSEAGRVVVVAAMGIGNAATVVDLDTGVATALAAHADPQPDDWGAMGAVHDVFASPTHVASAGIDGVLRIHTRDGALVREVPAMVTPVNRWVYAGPDTRTPAAFSADGRLLARGTPEGTIVVERVCDGEVLASWPIDPTLGPEGAVVQPSVLVFAPDGAALLAVYEGGVQAFSAP